MKTLTFFTLLFPCYIVLSLTPIDTCLKIYDIPEDETFSNPYNVRIDCCTRTGTYGEFFAKGYFSFNFDYNIIPRSVLFPEDTLIEYDISDIDSSYPEAIREFQKIESIFGTFKFVEGKPHLPDTTNLIYRSLLIEFDNYVHIRSAEDSIENINIVSSGGFSSWFIILSSVKSQEQQPGISIFFEENNLNIKSDNNYYNSQMEIYNIEGKLLFNKELSLAKGNNYLQIPELQNGLILVVIKTKSGDKVFKLLNTN